MQNQYHYQFVSSGLPEELHYINLKEVISHLKNHLNNFLLDPSVTACYINRIVQDKEILQDKEALSFLKYLLNKYIQLDPFDLNVLSLLIQIDPQEWIRKRISIIRKYAKNKIIDKINDIVKTNNEKSRHILHTLIKDNPDNILLAQKALLLDYLKGIAPGQWINYFKCPQELSLLWKIYLFEHYAKLNIIEEAYKLWNNIYNDLNLKENTLNLAAEILVKCGKLEQAISCYKKSLKLDKLQIPVKLRLKQLESPLPLNKELLISKKVNIYLYTYNKEKFLLKTLKSLLNTDIGNSQITVLLNGCTDNSKEILKKFNTIKTIELPINIGAPAARNWLIAQEDTWKCDYIAFLDDDITLSKNWLINFLNVAEQDQKTAVVGGKILFPQKPSRLQYLYRNFSIIRKDLLRISLDAPNNQFDNNVYDFVRETWNVMGCCHLLKTSALKKVPYFDIRFSPSQMDDIAHDIELKLKGYRIKYCGLVSIVHYQNSGIKGREDYAKFGNVIGNDVKFFYKFISLLT
ncbi:Glycosyltransferase, GT2 family [Desulfonauticus submarinus]|uniref:Glycosyltransferase, GT2 family n=1 Tax=Desulfonauticus submarinus TaxID=206665 RepID=A0A1H0BFP9_9BACT|nr:glycosyltransferase [Desulfonauticus submarinus]SDN44213.1 Glycosyltransferase, GT2 family [Desulfonauticus submarinus]